MCLQWCNCLLMTFLTRELYWHKSQSTIRPSIYSVRLWNNPRIRSKNQLVLSNLGRLSRRQREHLIGFKLTTGRDSKPGHHAYHANTLPLRYQATCRPPGYLTNTLYLKLNPVTCMQVFLFGVVLTFRTIQRVFYDEIIRMRTEAPTI